MTPIDPRGHDRPSGGLYVGAAFGHRGAAPGRAAAAYSPYLLSGILRCGVCGARMSAATATRRKGEQVYRYVWYRCGFNRDKGPAVSTGS
jgi:hypothetical protein